MGTIELGWRETAAFSFHTHDEEGADAGSSSSADAGSVHFRQGSMCCVIEVDALPFVSSVISALKAPLCLSMCSADDDGDAETKC